MHFKFKRLYKALLFFLLGFSYSANGALINVSFVMDASGSVGFSNWERQENFVIDLIGDFAALETDELDFRFAVLQFASYAKVKHSFGHVQDSVEAIQSRVRNLYFTRGATYTKTAVQKVIDEHTKFAYGADLHLSYLITDGNPYPTYPRYTPSPERDQNPCHLRSELDNAGIEMTVVGIGPGFTPNIVNCLTRGPERMIQVSDFIDLGDAAIRQQITQLANGQNAISVSEPGAHYLFFLALLVLVFAPLFETSAEPRFRHNDASDLLIG